MQDKLGELGKTWEVAASQPRKPQVLVLPAAFREYHAFEILGRLAWLFRALLLFTCFEALWY